METTAVLLPSMEEQIAAGDSTIIDPISVRIPEMPMPLFANFSYRVPEDVAGKVTRVWLEGGRLLCAVEGLPYQIGIASLVRDDGSHDLLSVGIAAAPRWRP